MNLTKEEERVLLAIPKGHGNAIRKEQLAKVVGMSVRRVRDVIEHLICTHGAPIGSSTNSVGGGYFIITDDIDFEIATRHLKPRAVAIFKRLRALERIAAREFGSQLSLLDELTG